MGYRFHLNQQVLMQARVAGEAAREAKKAGARNVRMSYLARFEELLNRYQGLPPNPSRYVGSIPKSIDYVWLKHEWQKTVLFFRDGFTDFQPEQNEKYKEVMRRWYDLVREKESLKG